MTEQDRADDDGLMVASTSSATEEASDDLGADPGTGEIPEPDGPTYPNVYAFVEQHMSVLYARSRPGGQNPWKWCPSWWAHPEAMSRLEALWQAFEALRKEPGVGPAKWWRDFADPTMDALTSQTGPFAQCKVDEHRPPEPLPMKPPHWALMAEHTPALLMSTTMRGADDE